MITIKAIHPSGFPVDVQTEFEAADQQIKLLISQGYRPAIQGDQYQRTPDGLPICPKHQAPMDKREKQGDIWHSHKIVDTITGEVLYCRGHPGKSSPGWDVQPEPEPPAPKLKYTIPQPTKLQPPTQEVEYVAGQPNQTKPPRETFYKIAGDAIKNGKITAEAVNKLAKLAKTNNWGVALNQLQGSVA